MVSAVFHTPLDAPAAPAAATSASAASAMTSPAANTPARPRPASAATPATGIDWAQRSRALWLVLHNCGKLSIKLRKSQAQVS